MPGTSTDVAPEKVSRALSSSTEVAEDLRRTGRAIARAVGDRRAALREPRFRGGR